MSEYLVVGHFAYANEAEHAIQTLRKSEAKGTVQYFSPFPEHHLEDAQYDGEPRSPVRFFTLAGGLFGCMGAFLFTTWMSVDYPLRVSAKPLISVPAFIVIAFECTILLGAIATLLSMLFYSRVPSLSFVPGYSPGFSEGTFGVAVRATQERAEALKEQLASFGAETVEVQYVR